jgi:hypothetical protein
MNDRLQEAKLLVERWKPRLGMNLWEIDVYVSADSSNDWTMQTQFQDNYDRGSIEIHPRVVGVTPSDPINKSFDHDVASNDSKFEKLIVHEMLHLLMRRRDRGHRRMIEHVPEELREAFTLMIEDANEEIVEQISRTLVRVAPIGVKV